MAASEPVRKDPLGVLSSGAGRSEHGDGQFFPPGLPGAQEDIGVPPGALSSAESCVPGQVLPTLRAALPPAGPRLHLAVEGHTRPP